MPVISAGISLGILSTDDREPLSGETTMVSSAAMFSSRQLVRFAMLFSSFLVSAPFGALANGDQQSEASGGTTDSVSKQSIESGRSSSDQSDIKALQPFSVLVGKWRAVGQLQRGSSNGSWSEEISGAWDFSEDSARLIIVSTEHRQFRRLILSADPESLNPVAVLEMSRKTEPNANEKSSPEPLIVTMTIDPMTIGKETVVFQSSSGQLPIRRCTIRRISEIRMSILLEQKNTETGTFRRVSELGMTRAGERLAKGNSGERQCIVTGGLGTISVSHNGMTFYVCCEGCLQAFQEDPDGIIAAWRERLRTEK